MELKPVFLLLQLICLSFLRLVLGFRLYLDLVASGHPGYYICTGHRCMLGLPFCSQEILVVVVVVLVAGPLFLVQVSDRMWYLYVDRFRAC